MPRWLSGKNLPAKQEAWVESLSWEDLLEKERATHSSILAWEIPWAEEPGGYSPGGHKESDTILESILESTFISCWTGKVGKLQ